MALKRRHLCFDPMLPSIISSVSFAGCLCVLTCMFYMDFKTNSFTEQVVILNKRVDTLPRTHLDTKKYRIVYTNTLVKRWIRNYKTYLVISNPCPYVRKRGRNFNARIRLRKHKNILLSFIISQYWERCNPRVVDIRANEIGDNGPSILYCQHQWRLMTGQGKHSDQYQPGIDLFLLGYKGPILKRLSICFHVI